MMVLFEVFYLCAIVQWSHNANKLTLNWTDNSDNEDGFVIQRAKKRRGRFNFVSLDDTVFSNEVIFVDTVDDTGDYKYRVTAYKNSNFVF
jgi:hypothetical protein